MSKQHPQIQPLRSAVAERVMQRIRYFPWWVLHPIQYHRSESFRRALDMIGREFLDLADDGCEINVGCEVTAEAGYSMILRFERDDP